MTKIDYFPLLKWTLCKIFNFQLYIKYGLDLIMLLVKVEDSLDLFE